MSKRVGARTVALPSRPGILSWASVVGRKEHEGPYGERFDQILEDELNGETSFESAERKMLETAVTLCARKAGRETADVQMLLAGDLLNQIVSAGYAARNLQIPFYGLYGACSTMTESLSLGAMLADGGYADRLIAATCSHFCTAERQYRAPLELGNQRTPTAQWTVTGSGAVMVVSGPAARHTRVRVTHTTCGRVIDLGIADANNMGAAMAPAAADSISAHLADTGRSFDDFDLVATGDLGRLGRDLLIELLLQQGIAVQEEKLFDCGCEIFSPRQDVHAGGSGCGCAASMLCGYLLPELYAGRLRRILFMATGALLSPTTTMQGESIPGVAHAVVLEHEEGGRLMELLWLLVRVFIVGGLLCAFGQLLILKTKLTSARILVGYVTAGVILGALGIYKPLVDFAGAGATVPLTGFGYLLAKGAMEGAKSEGLLGAFTGGVTAGAGGIAAAVFFGYLAALIFKPKMKD